MSNYSLDDRHRSIRRFVMNAMGSPPWRVRTERQPVHDDERPAAVVEVVPGVRLGRHRVSIPQGQVEKGQSFALTLYPALPEDRFRVALTGAEARLAAQTAAQQLDRAITVGLVTDDMPPVDLTRPYRIPVYDFAGVPVKGAGRAGPAEPYGWLWVEDAPVDALQDPDDALRWTVTCVLRVSWEEMGRDVDPAPLVGDFSGAWQNP